MDNSTEMKLLTLLLTVVFISNLLFGLAAFFAPTSFLIQGINLAYGGHVSELSLQSVHVIRIVGAFLLTVAAMVAYILRDPIKNKELIYVVCGLLVMRVIQRVIFAEETVNSFGLSYARNWVNAGFFLLVAAALFFLLPKKAKKK